MKQNKEKFDFKAFGQAIKAARKAKGISRNQLADKLNIAPRYIASIENSGQHPSLQILYELVTLLDVSVDQLYEISGRCRALYLRQSPNGQSRIRYLSGISSHSCLLHRQSAG